MACHFQKRTLIFSIAPATCVSMLWLAPFFVVDPPDRRDAVITANTSSSAALLQGGTIGVNAIDSVRNATTEHNASTVLVAPQGGDHPRPIYADEDPEVRQMAPLVTRDQVSQAQAIASRTQRSDCMGAHALAAARPRFGTHRLARCATSPDTRMRNAGSGSAGRIAAKSPDWRGSAARGLLRQRM